MRKPLFLRAPIHQNSSRTLHACPPSQTIRHSCSARTLQRENLSQIWSCCSAVLTTVGLASAPGQENALRMNRDDPSARVKQHAPMWASRMRPCHKPSTSGACSCIRRGIVVDSDVCLTASQTLHLLAGLMQDQRNRVCWLLLSRQPQCTVHSVSLCLCEQKPVPLAQLWLARHPGTWHKRVRRPLVERCRRD
jgi:hypothetical protein